MLGGNGYVEQGVMARFFREAPVNSIWEGAGNIMCLDVVSALSREPDCVDALTSDLKDMSSGCPILTEELSHLSTLARSTPEVLEASARILAQQLVLIAQACLLRRYSTTEVSDAFVKTRLSDRRSGRVVGAIDLGSVRAAPILSRARAA